MYQDDYRRIDEMMRKKGVFTNLETGKQYYTGYEYATLYDWDQYFEAIVQLYLGWQSDYARLGVEIFLDMQKETVIFSAHPTEVNISFWSTSSPFCLKSVF